MRSHNTALLRQQLHIAQIHPVPELGREAEAQAQKAAQKVLVLHVPVGMPNLPPCPSSSFADTDP